MTEIPEKIEIEYETDIEETIDANIRWYWLQKHAWINLFLNTIIIPAFIIFVLYNLHTEHTLLLIAMFLAFWSTYLFYGYGTGYRKKTRKYLEHNLGGRPFPKIVIYNFDEKGISFQTEFASQNYPWSMIKKIDEYKNFVEIRATIFLIQLRKEHAPDISVLNEMWEKYR